MVVSGAVFFVFPDALVSLFTDDPEVHAIGATLMRIAAAFQLFDGVQGVAAGALRGAGDVKIPFYVNVGAHWGVGLPMALFLGFYLGWGAPGLWCGLLIGLGLVAVLLTARFLRLTRGRVSRVA